MKKIITILLSILMVVSLGTVAFAENGQTSKTISDPVYNVQIKPVGDYKGYISSNIDENWTKELNVAQGTTIYLKADTYDDGREFYSRN